MHSQSRVTWWRLEPFFGKTYWELHVVLFSVKNFDKLDFINDSNVFKHVFVYFSIAFKMYIFLNDFCLFIIAGWNMVRVALYKRCVYGTYPHTVGGGGGQSTVLQTGRYARRSFQPPLALPIVSFYLTLKLYLSLPKHFKPWGI